MRRLCAFCTTGIPHHVTFPTAAHLRPSHATRVTLWPKRHCTTTTTTTNKRRPRAAGRVRHPTAPIGTAGYVTPECVNWMTAVRRDAAPATNHGAEAYVVLSSTHEPVPVERNRVCSMPTPIGYDEHCPSVRALERSRNVAVKCGAKGRGFHQKHYDQTSCDAKRTSSDTEPKTTETDHKRPPVRKPMFTEEVPAEPLAEIAFDASEKGHASTLSPAPHRSAEQLNDAAAVAAAALEEWMADTAEDDDALSSVDAPSDDVTTDAAAALDAAQCQGTSEELTQNEGRTFMSSVDTSSPSQRTYPELPSLTDYYKRRNPLPWDA